MARTTVPAPWLIEGLEKLRREQGRERPRVEMPAPPPPEPVEVPHEVVHNVVTWEA